MIEHRHPAARSGELDWLLDDSGRCASARCGTPWCCPTTASRSGASSGLSREDAEHLAAVASGFHSLAKGAGRHFGAGGVRQTMVEMDDGFLFVAAAGDGSCLAVLSAVDRRHRPGRLRDGTPGQAGGRAPLHAAPRRRSPARGRVTEMTGAHGRGPDRRPGQPGSQWYDDEAGPLVRPYAMTGGRTKPGPTGVRFDLIALVTLDTGAPDAATTPRSARNTGPCIELCRTETQSVAELAADADLPVGVVRVLLGDLLELGCVKVSRPVPPAQLPDERILREVIEGLRAL